MNAIVVRDMLSTVLPLPTELLQVIVEYLVILDCNQICVYQDSRPVDIAFCMKWVCDIRLEQNLWMDVLKSNLKKIQNRDMSTFMEDIKDTQEEYNASFFSRSDFAARVRRRRVTLITKLRELAKYMLNLQLTLTLGYRTTPVLEPLCLYLPDTPITLNVIKFRLKNVCFEPGVELETVECTTEKWREKFRSYA